MSKGRNSTMLAVRLPDDLYKEILRRAKYHNQSISDWMRSFLRIEFGKESSDALPQIRDDDTIFAEAALFRSLSENSRPEISQQPMSEKNEGKQHSLVNIPQNEDMIESVRNRQCEISPESDWEYFKKHSDKNCPCGSKKPYKHCHGT